MAYPPITALPTPPSRSDDPDNFSTKADAFLGALPDFGTEANALGSYLDGVAGDVDTVAAAAAASAVAAAGSATDAATSATEAAASATLAAATANYQGVYDAGTTYQIGDSVSYNGSIWLANTVNTGITPVSGANWYELSSDTFTTGSIVFGGADGTLSEDNSNFFWDDTNNRLGIGNATPATPLDVTGTTSTTSLKEGVYSITGTTPALDPANGGIQNWTLTANSTPTDSFAAGQSMLLMIDDGTAYTITWPTMTWIGGSAPTLDTSGLTTVELWKRGGVLYGALVGVA